MINHSKRLQTIKNEHFSGTLFGFESDRAFIAIWNLFFFVRLGMLTTYAATTNTRHQFNTAAKPKTLHKIPAGCNASDPHLKGVLAPYGRLTAS